MKYLPKSKWKKAGLILLFLFGLFQFYPRPEKNISSVETKERIEKLYNVPDSVMVILKSACYDCHSNNTRYPWYSNIQPVALFLNMHIVDGKKELNFDEFGSYSTRRQQSKLKAIASQVRDREMPLRSYSIMHKNARLTSGERDYIITYFLQKIKEFK
ncbi:MAG: heme-binding domain-containing protein [Bacteroidetes bacterium]|nr:heme-binding domain-containing protein [Bacteroidota bacterium]